METTLADCLTALRYSIGHDAATLHRSAVYKLRDAGFAVWREFEVGIGRVDILAVRDGFRVAIELDRKSPRWKSLAKLQTADADARVVVLREPGWVPVSLGGVVAVVANQLKR